MKNDAHGVAARLNHLVVECAALIVPYSDRKEWLFKWNSELWYVRREAPASKDVWWFCLGSFRDALWTRQHSSKEGVGFMFTSPLSCITLLISATLLSSLAAFLLPGARDILLLNLHTKSSFYWLHSWAGVSEYPANPIDQQIVIFRLTFICACAILPAVTSLRLGSGSASSSPDFRVSRFCAIGFFFLKVVLISLLVYFVALDLRDLFAPEGNWLIQVTASLAGFVLSFRWVLDDQRKRCPTCLRRLKNPVRVGRPSWILLDWNCLERVCPQGHGVSHQPAESLSGSIGQTWIPMDSYWTGILQD